jgi:SAM-dependent methyltransferase
VFAADWLSLREPVDHRTRAAGLIGPLERAWTARGWSRVVDLGSGTGSNCRYLAPRLPGPQAWTLVDHDASLLSSGRIPPEAEPVRRIVADLRDLGSCGFDDADLIAGGALLDLVSMDWLSALVGICTSGGRGALFSTVYDGTVSWSSPGRAGPIRSDPRGMADSDDDEDDEFVLALVNAHQVRDKGLGPALGPAAAPEARALFEASGYQTWLAPSPWLLGPEDAALARMLVAGWEDAACAQSPDDAGRIRKWAEARGRRIGDGRFRLTVGHLDLLALPPDPAHSG